MVGGGQSTVQHANKPWSRTHNATALTRGTMVSFQQFNPHTSGGGKPSTVQLAHRPPWRRPNTSIYDAVDNHQHINTRRGSVPSTVQQAHKPWSRTHNASARTRETMVSFQQFNPHTSGAGKPSTVQPAHRPPWRRPNTSIYSAVDNHKLINTRAGGGASSVQQAHKPPWRTHNASARTRETMVNFQQFNPHTSGGGKPSTVQHAHKPRGRTPNSSTRKQAWVQADSQPLNKHTRPPWRTPNSSIYDAVDNHKHLNTRGDSEPPKVQHKPQGRTPNTSIYAAVENHQRHLNLRRS